MSLPTPQKLIGIGSVIAILGAFLPWYKDIDSFNTGDSFLGVTGPLYLVGYIVIALSVFTLILTSFHYLEKKLPPLPMKESLIYILSGATALFLLVVANSVFFHPKFGVNILSKSYQIGMIFCFLSSLAVLAGGILQQKERGTSRFIKEFQDEAGAIEEELDPVLELNNFQKEQQESSDVRIKKEEPKVATHEKSSDGIREYKAKSEPTSTESKSSADAPKGRMEPYPDVAMLKKEAPARAATPAASPSKVASDDDVNPNTVIRMDL